jgi:hypothetical protein
MTQRYMGKKAAIQEERESDKTPTSRCQTTDAPEASKEGSEQSLVIEIQK